MRSICFLVIFAGSLFSLEKYEIKLPDQSAITYEIDDFVLTRVVRKNAQNEELYSCHYEWDESGKLIRQTGYFITEYEYDDKGRLSKISNPYLKEDLEYDEENHLIRKEKSIYCYDAKGQIISESSKFEAVYDEHRNLIQLNDTAYAIEEDNRLQGFSYDSSGNLIRLGFVYNSKSQLVQAADVHYLYDDFGKRSSKENIDYFYVGEEEIASIENGQIIELQVIGAGPVAIELRGKPFFPVVDACGIIRKLVDPETGVIVKENHCDIFARGLKSDIPYAYRGKRYDPETGLIYFGKRYYDPTLQRWLTPDPLGAIDDPNLYQFTLNNPNAYFDPTGEFVVALPLLYWGAGLSLPALSTITTTLIYGASAGAAAYGGYKLIEAANAKGCGGNGDYYAGELIWIPKRGSTDSSLPKNPDDLLKRPGWKETTHPDASKKGHRTFENEKTGEILRHDQGKPGYPGHKAHDHYHHQVPDGKGGYTYVDGTGNPVPAGSNQAHLYPE